MDCKSELVVVVEEDEEEMDQMKDKETLLFPPPQIEVYPSPVNERVVFLKIEILFWEFNNATGTFIDEDTTKLFNRDPQPFKKLHNFTSNE